jgi:hypothetical protein
VTYTEFMYITVHVCTSDVTYQTAILSYTFEVCQTLVSSRETRLKVLRILVKLHQEQAVCINVT